MFIKYMCSIEIRSILAVLNRKVRKRIIADKILNACVVLQYVGKPVLHIVVSSDNPFCLAELPLIAPYHCFTVPHLYLLKVLKMKNQHSFSTVCMLF